MTPSRRRKLTVAAIAIAATAVIAIYASFDPGNGFFPACPVKTLTGFDCPGCGSQRALHALLTGRVVDAWHYNAILFILVPVAAVMVVAELMRDSHPRFYRRMTSQWTVAAVIAAVIVWTIARNVF